MNAFRLRSAHPRGVRRQPVDETRHVAGDAALRIPLGAARERRACGAVAGRDESAHAVDAYVVIVVVLFVSGLFRSLQFGAVNTLSFADVPKQQMSGASTLSSTIQQRTIGMGVALGAIALRIAAWVHGHGAQDGLGRRISAWRFCWLRRSASLRSSTCSSRFARRRTCERAPACEDIDCSDGAGLRRRVRLLFTHVNVATQSQ